MKNKIDLLIRFGTIIRQLRKNKGFSQEELALKSDLDRTYIGGVERGERNLSLVNIARLANALEIPISSIFMFMEGKE